MTSVGKKLTLNFSRGKSTKKKSMEHHRDDLDVDNSAYVAYRKSSIGTLQPPLGVPSGKTSKSNSLGSIIGDLDSPLDHEDIISLTHDVRSFSEALARLKTVFSYEDEGSDYDMRVCAHKELGEVLYILRNVLQKYPALHTTDVLTAAAILITKIKSCNYDDPSSDMTDLHYSIDQLALAFSSSVSEYLMGDVDTYPQIGKTKSYDNLASAADSDIGGSTEHLDTRDNLSMTREDLDGILMKLESGVDIALQRAKVWSKYAKDIIAYVEKRTNLEIEFTKSLHKLSAGVRQTVTEDTYLPFQSIYCTALDHDIEYASTSQTSNILIQTQKFIEPLNARRMEHEKTRKNIKDAWSRELRKMQESIGNLRKARALYVQRQQEYEKAKDVAQKAESESLSQSSSGNKAEKKRRLEEDAMHRAIEAETTYKACVIEANNRQQDLEKVKGDVLSQIWELIQQCDQTMKAVTVGYFQLQHAVTAPLPVQYQTLCDSSQQYEPGAQYAEYIRHLPVPSNYIHNAEPFTFEPYTPETKGLVERKPSTQSSGSGSSDIQYADLESPSSGRTHHDKRGNPLKAWSQQGGPGSDSDSVSGSSSKSRESSPSASPYNRHRSNLHTSSSMNELVEADRDAQFDSRVNSVGIPLSAESGLNSFRGVTLSKPARTHAFRKLRTPSKCRECESYVYFQGAECERCGISSHKKCLETLHFECGHKAMERRMTTFGVDFIEHVQETQTEIPHLIRKCTAELDTRGLHTKGLFRVSGVKSRVEKLCQSFENDEGNVDLNEHHPNVIANVLKLYLRQLPEPLLTFKLYPDFIQFAKDESAEKNPDEARTVQKLKALMDQLPKPNHRTCKMLMHHLKRVTQEEDINQMSAGNLGIVFGPTLLRPSEGAASLNSLMDTPHQTRVVDLLISHVDILFGPEDRTDIPLVSIESKEEETPVEVLVEGSTNGQSSEPAGGTASGDGGLGAESGPQREEGSSAESAQSESKWYVPEITENLLDELAKEEPRFQQVSGEFVNLPGSTDADAQAETDPNKLEESRGDSDSASDDDLPDNLLPDDSAPRVPSPAASKSEAEAAKPSAKPEDTSSQLESSISFDINTPTSRTRDQMMSISSPGLRRKLLPTELRTRQTNSTFYTPPMVEAGRDSPENMTVIPSISLSKPRPYSPPLQRRIRPSTKADRTITKPGQLDVQEQNIPRTTVVSKSTFYAPSVVVTSDLNQGQGQGQSRVTEHAEQTVMNTSSHLRSNTSEREPAFV